MESTRLTEIRHGERNFIRTGDLVRLRPSQAGKHDGALAKFLYADVDKGGLFYHLLTIDRDGTPMGHRFVKPERVKRLATTKHPKRPAKRAK